MESNTIRQITTECGISLKKEYSFDRFVRGESNRLACAASKAVAESPAKAYNPLFIHGSVGLGKTHLLHAIGNYIANNDLSTRVMYITSERFAIELINSIRKDATEKFRKIFRKANVLLIDDVHFFKNKKGTQEELFHTFNELYENDKQIVLSSDRSPHELSKLQDRLVSRFRWGLVTDIQKPNIETREAILQQKAIEHGIEVPEEILHLIASRISSNVRALEGALIRAIAYSHLQQEDLSPETIDGLLPKENKEGAKLTVGCIKEEVAKRYQLTVDQLEGPSRKKEIAFARHVAMYLTRELTDNSYPSIGKKFGGRDHSTVMYSYRKIKQLEETPLWRGEIKELKDSLVSKFGPT